MTPSRRRSSITKLLVALAMLAAICATVAFVRWDEKREEEAALEDIALEQTRAAVATAAVLRARLETAEATPSAVPRAGADGASALREMAAIERPGEVVLLLLPPRAENFTTTSGRAISLPVVRDALNGAATSVRLSREEAVSAGLPARAAFAGIARVDAGAAGEWGVAVVGSASHERARELRSRIRLVVSATFVAGVVFMLGTLTFRRMAKEMEFERELSLAEVRRRSDERLVRASRAAVMGTLATGVAHEMGTPLGIIAARAEQLEKKLAGDDRAVRSARVILEQVERMHLVVRGFLNLARGGEPALARVEAKTLTEGAIRLTQHRFEKAGVALQSDVDDADRRAEIQCDPKLFEHALVNLLLNGCEACARGGEVIIQIRSDGQHVTFAVDDDGIGIRSEDAARAVEPFFTTKPVGQGTGLGLAITNEIVKAHRGVLTIAPRDPRGTRATIEVPIARAEANERAA